jgi:acetyl-CoA C-acetyltransferase
MLDTYAASSQQRAAAAAARGQAPSLVPVTGPDGQVLLDRDENIRPATTAQTLAGMQPAFAGWGAKGGDAGFDAQLCRRLQLAAIDHVHHAGNSPAMADAAAAVLVGSQTALQAAGLQARARILGFADTGSDRTLALTGTVDAARLALARAGKRAEDMDLFEINEGFAAMALHFMQDMQVGHDRMNVNGGAIAIGHAMGCTGAADAGTAIGTGAGTGAGTGTWLTLLTADVGALVTAVVTRCGGAAGADVAVSSPPLPSSCALR